MDLFCLYLVSLKSPLEEIFVSRRVMALLPLTTHSARAADGSVHIPESCARMADCAAAKCILVNNCFILTFQTVHMPHGQFLLLLKHWTHCQELCVCRQLEKTSSGSSSGVMLCIFWIYSSRFRFYPNTTNQFNILKGRHVV